MIELKRKDDLRWLEQLETASAQAAVDRGEIDATAIKPDGLEFLGAASSKARDAVWCGSSAYMA